MDGSLIKYLGRNCLIVNLLSLTIFVAMNKALFTYLFRKFCPWLILAIFIAIVQLTIQPLLHFIPPHYTFPILILAFCGPIIFAKDKAQLDCLLISKGFTRQMIISHLIVTIIGSYLLFVICVSLFLLSPIRYWFMSFSNLSPFIHYYPKQEIMNLITTTIIQFTAFSCLISYGFQLLYQNKPSRHNLFLFVLWYFPSYVAFASDRNLSAYSNFLDIAFCIMGIILIIQNFYDQEYSS